MAAAGCGGDSGRLRLFAPRRAAVRVAAAHGPGGHPGGEHPVVGPVVRRGGRDDHAPALRRRRRPVSRLQRRRRRVGDGRARVARQSHPRVHPQRAGRAELAGHAGRGHR